MDEEIKHVIYDCDEVVPLYKEYGTKLVYVDKNSFENSGIYNGQTLPVDCLNDPKEQGIAMVVCNKTTKELIKNGMIIVLYKKIFYLAAGIDRDKLSFIQTDEKGRIKVTR